MSDSPRQLTGSNVRDSCISSSTKSAYRSYINGISKWLRETRDDPDQYFDAPGVLNLTTFTPELFEEFLLAQINKPGKKLSVVTLGGYRSAIKNQYRIKRMALPAKYGEELTTFFSGLKRIQGDDLQSGSARTSGKMPLTYSLYEKVSCETLRLNDGGFAHLFLSTQWNLMCRSKSVETIDTSHLSSEDDSVGITLHKTKTNQEGNGPKDPRHLYGNPFCPSTCWITALAVYLACNPMQDQGKLFPGANQKNRFHKALDRAFAKINVPTERLGTHSIRKGVATFACSGSTGGPSIVSVCLRCGWSLGGVQDRYFRYESAGDQYLGRVVAGLPLNDYNFGVLPPHFIDNDNQAVAQCVNETFPLLKNGCHLFPILQLCLASLVYHEQYLRATMGPSHALMSCYLFRNPSLISTLKNLVQTSNSPWMRSSGIPPHIYLYKQQHELQEAVDKLPNTLMDGFAKVIEDKGVGAGNITKELLNETIRSLLVEVGLQRPAIVQQRDVESSSVYNVHFWGGKYHMLPQDFEFPSIDALGAWKLWWFGNGALGYPPFKSITTNDLSDLKKKKTYSEWSMLMKHITEAAEARTGTRIAKDINESEATRLFDIGMSSFVNVVILIKFELPKNVLAFL